MSFIQVLLNVLYFLQQDFFFIVKLNEYEVELLLLYYYCYFLLSRLAVFLNDFDTFAQKLNNVSMEQPQKIGNSNVSVQQCL